MQVKTTHGLVGAIAMLAAAGATASTVSVNPSLISVAPGDTFTANIQADFTDVGGTVEGGFQLTWDASKLTLVNAVFPGQSSVGESGHSSTIQSAFNTLFASFVFPTNVENSAAGSLDYAFSLCGIDVTGPVCEVVGASAAFSVYDLVFEVAADAAVGDTPADLVIGVLGDQWTGADGFTVLNPTFSGATIAINAVPVPAAVWLFGSGLLGLVGVARRRMA